ncbi:helix-turn-helix domain-containing protein [Streptomyces sp. NPDC046876]|uniref:helix-turn-helix domain-containing protein n=1 Tax=Streptomyces sp. NPDC046876 TaxID=3155616 RepID=UPI003405BD8F
MSSGRHPRYATGRALRQAVRSGVRELSRRRAGAMALDAEAHTVFLHSLERPSEPAPAPVLVAVAPRPGPDGLAPLLADAASTLSLCWRAEHAERLRHRAATAEDRTRQAALHLLMNGHTAPAHRLSTGLQPQLPGAIRVWILEGAPGTRRELAGRVRTNTPNAWTVPCPANEGHVIVLAPPHDEPATDGCRVVGVSDAVALSDASTGYAQAVHALAAARLRTDRRAAFASHPDLILAIGPAVTGWAESLLAPLREAHSARRPQDPGSRELLATAAAWLSRPSQATAHLSIHRNTLSARLRHIARQLALDLDRLADRSALALALRALDAPWPAGGPQHGGPALRSLDDLLDRPAVTRWAHTQLQPLTDPTHPPHLAQTLTAWLHHDARTEATAAALSLSPTAVRKRLARAEALLQRPLHSPPTRHTLWLAHHALGLSPVARRCSAGR